MLVLNLITQGHTLLMAPRTTRFQSFAVLCFYPTGDIFRIHAKNASCRETILRGDGYWHSQQDLANEGDFGFLWSPAIYKTKLNLVTRVLSYPSVRSGRERDPDLVWSRGPRTKLIPREESFVSQLFCLVRFHRSRNNRKARQIC